MRKISSTNPRDRFQLNGKKSLRLIGTVTLFAAPIIVGTMFVQTASRAVVPEPISPRRELVVPTQHLRFTLYNDGIYPPKATVRAGLVSIGIEDMADANGGLLIERLTTGPRTVVGRVERLHQHLRGRASVDLTPGTYRLRVLGSQANEAELTVEP